MADPSWLHEWRVTNHEKWEGEVFSIQHAGNNVWGAKWTNNRGESRDLRILKDEDTKKITITEEGVPNGPQTWTGVYSVGENGFYYVSGFEQSGQYGFDARLQLPN